MSMEYQNKIAQAIRERGYRDGWSDETFAARQVAKLVEEVGELGSHFSFQDESFGEELADMGNYAREVFDDKDAWRYTEIISATHIAKELADVLVVVYNMADAIGVDVNQLAYDKAKADVNRGVRGKK